MVVAEGAPSTGPLRTPAGLRFEVTRGRVDPGETRALALAIDRLARAGQAGRQSAWTMSGRAAVVPSWLAGAPWPRSLSSDWQRSGD